MVVFLERYRDSYTSESFRNKFCYAVNDFIDDKRDLRNRYSDIWERLEKLANNVKVIDGRDDLGTESFIKECIEGKHEGFVREFSRYLVAFMRKNK